MRITYETHYESKREDGRYTSSMAAHMAWLRDLQPELAFPQNISCEEFAVWKNKVKEKVKGILLMPEFTKQPDPKLLYRVKRDTYTVEKWEFYPDDYTAVPFLALIPDGVTKENPAPGVMCFPGSIYSKEFLAGEPLLESKPCRFEKYPERNRIALYMVKAGYVAFAFDPVAIAECGLESDHDGNWGYEARSQLCHGYIQSGLCYPGVSVFQKLVFMDILKKFEYVDMNNLAIAAHSLGTKDAGFLGVLCDEIKAVVFNDFVCDERQRYVSVTEYEENQMCNNRGNWHEIPGMFRYFTRPDLLCAMAPKYLALTEGGAEFYLDKVRNAYKTCKAEDRLCIVHYPKYKEEADRSKVYEPPMYGLSQDASFEFYNVDAPDHSFRKDAAMEFLKRIFG